MHLANSRETCKEAPNSQRKKMCLKLSQVSRKTADHQRY